MKRLTKTARLIETAAERVCGIIKARAAGKKFTRTAELRQWLRIEFGAPVRGLTLPIEETAYITGDRTAIVLNTAQPAWRQVHLLIHELSEWILLSEQPELGLLERAKIGYNGDGATGLRHAISERVGAMIAEAWGLRDVTNSFSLVDKLCVLSPTEIAKYSVPRPPIERIDTIDPEGRTIGRLAT